MQVLIPKFGDNAEVEWITWYLCPPLRSRSGKSRALNAEQHHWMQRLRILWQDQFHPNLDARVYVVAPDPPRAFHQTHVGHLLLVQGSLDDHVPILLTTFFETALGHRLGFLACFVPSFFSVPQLISTARLDRVCQRRGCYADVAGAHTPFLMDWAKPMQVMALVFMFPRVLPVLSFCKHDLQFDTINFL